MPTGHDYPPIDEDVLTALKSFRDRRGRFWKASLRQSWVTNSPKLCNFLHSLRNTHGPRWLKDFQLPKE